MSESLDREIRTLRAQYWSDRDPEGRAFAPLAEAYRRRGELEEAASLVEDGLARLPDFTTGHLVASRVARDRGDLPASREHLDRILVLDPEHVTALLERAEVGVEAGDRGGAISDLRAVIELEPGHEEARSLLRTLEEVLDEPLIEEPDEVRGGEEGEAESGPGFSELAGLEVGNPDAEAPERGGLELDEDAIDFEAWGRQGWEEELSEPPSSGSGDAPSGEIEIEAMELEASEPGGTGAAAADAPQDIVESEDIVEAEAHSLDSGEGPPATEPADPPPQNRSLYTRTMGDLYARQGLDHRALEVYEHLSARDPYDADLAARVAELRERAWAGAREPDHAEIPDSMTEAADSTAETAAPVSETAVRVSETAQPVSDRGVATAGGSGRPISAYFDDLLAWEPGAVPIASLAPDPGAELPAPAAADTTAKPAADPSAKPAADTSAKPAGDTPAEPAGDTPAEPAGDTIAPAASGDPAPTRVPPDPAPPSDASPIDAEGEADPGKDEDEDEDEDGLDDFNAWLESLQP